jgi:hypothetical protein
MPESASVPDPASPAAVRPLLATPEQVAAEQTLLRLLPDPRLRQIQAELRAELALTPRGQRASGAATLDHAIQQWTNSLLMAEISIHQPTPSITWGTENTPRNWLGHTLPGIGTSGDNPDAIYRLAVIDGTRRYEVLGCFDQARRPAQVTLELHRGAKVTPPPLNGKMSDLMPLASISDRALNVAPSGTFRFTIGPEVESPVHMSTEPGRLTLGFRDMLADWTQRPSSLELRPLDQVAPAHFTDQDILDAAYHDLPPYVRFWSSFPNVWFGGLSGNVITPVQGRTGGLAGFIAALSFDLADEEAIVVTMEPAGAAYTGFQVIDPWLIGSDVRSNQVCLNRSQSTPSADGSVTYVISHSDPGVANWLSTGGLGEGFAIMRWQAVPASEPFDPLALARDFRVLKLSEVADLPGVPRFTPAQRQQQMTRRAAEYDTRVT